MSAASTQYHRVSCRAGDQFHLCPPRSLGKGVTSGLCAPINEGEKQSLLFCKKAKNYQVFRVPQRPQALILEQAPEFHYLLGKFRRLCIFGRGTSEILTLNQIYG